MDSNQFFHDLEIYRTPRVMKDYFESKRTEILNQTELTQLARLKIGKFKIFLEEFYPLYLLSQSEYVADDAEVRIVDGNQSYDGLIKSARGDISKVEFTEYLEGYWDNVDAKLLNARGYSDIRMRDTKDLKTRADEFMDKILNNASKKAKKDYRGVNIIILVNTLEYIDIWGFDRQNFITKLIERLRGLDFQADSVSLLIKNSDPIEDINKNLYKVV